MIKGNEVIFSEETREKCYVGGVEACDDEV